MEKEKLLALGFEETKKNTFVLYKSDPTYNSRKRRTIWERRRIGFIKLGEFGQIVEQKGFPEGEFLYKRINRPFGRR